MRHKKKKNGVHLEASSGQAKPCWLKAWVNHVGISWCTLNETFKI